MKGNMVVKALVRSGGNHQSRASQSAACNQRHLQIRIQLVPHPPKIQAIQIKSAESDSVAAWLGPQSTMNDALGRAGGAGVAGGGQAMYLDGDNAGNLKISFLLLLLFPLWLITAKS